MPALTITAASVIAGSNATKVPGTAGATITAGQAVYRDPTTKEFLLADADSATAAAWSVFGIALHGSADGQPLMVQTDGDITIGATMTVGEIYVLDVSAGGIAPRADLGSTEKTSIIGIARTAAVLQLAIENAGVALA